MGASFTAVTAKDTVAVSVSGSAAPFVVPLSLSVYSNLAGPLKFSVGENTTSVPTMLTLPPTALARDVMLSVWPISVPAPPALSLASRLAIEMV